MTKALSTGSRDAQAVLANVIVSTPEVCRYMKKSKHGKYVHRLAFQVLDACSSLPTSDHVRKQLPPPVYEVSPAVPPHANVKQGKTNRRGGGGGGLAAQAEAESRDILASLNAACLRRSPVRIQKAMERTHQLLMTPGLSPQLAAEAVQACQTA